MKRYKEILLTILSIAIISLIGILFGSCDYQFKNLWMGYWILKGDHYVRGDIFERKVPHFTNENNLNFEAQFASNSLYTPENKDLNKLYGFCDCNSSVHENSIRIAWRHDGLGKIEIFSYLYIDGKRYYDKLGETIPDKVDIYHLKAKDNLYTVRFNDTTLTYKRTKKCNSGVRTRLYPYFGGNKPAPNDMLILIYDNDL